MLRGFRLAASYEVAGHCHRGLEAIELLPEDERIGPEIEFITAIIPALQTTVGWASGELRQYYDRRMELAEVVGDPIQRFGVVVQTFASRFTEGHCTEALSLAGLLPEIAEALGQPAQMYLAYMCLMVAQLYEGRFAEALTSSEQAMAYVTPDSDLIILQAAGMSGQSYPHTYRAEIFWALGYPDQALAASETSITNARRTEHLASLAHAVGDSTHFLPHFGDPEAVLARVEDSRSIEEEQRSTFWEPFTGVYKGWALTVQGHHDEGIDLMRQSLARYLASGSGICQSHMRACLATGLMRAHRWDEALEVLAQARAVVDEIGERYFEAELYRLEAEVLMRRSADPSRRDLSAAEAHIRHALEMARAREAKSHELRAAMSLCRLQRQQGDPSEGRAVLREVYDWFTEGFETSDLVEARSLLDELPCDQSVGAG